MMMNAATMQVISEPKKVSILPKRMSRTSMPLSTTALCWKKICQGVMVVPMLAMMSMIRAPPDMRPKCWDGRSLGPRPTSPSATLPVCMAQMAAGM